MTKMLYFVVRGGLCTTRNNILSSLLNIKWTTYGRPNYKIYSVLNAITGSFFDAAFAGIDPPISVSIMLSTTSIIAFLA